SGSRSEGRDPRTDSEGRADHEGHRQRSARAVLAARLLQRIQAPLESNLEVRRRRQWRERSKDLNPTPDHPVVPGAGVAHPKVRLEILPPLRRDVSVPEIGVGLEKLSAIDHRSSNQ